MLFTLMKRRKKNSSESYEQKSDFSLNTATDWIKWDSILTNCVNKVIFYQSDFVEHEQFAQ